MFLVLGVNFTASALFLCGRTLLIVAVHFLPNAHVRHSLRRHAHDAIAKRMSSGTSNSGRRSPGGYAEVGDHRGARVTANHAYVAAESVSSKIRAGIYEHQNRWTIILGNRNASQ